MQSGTLKNRTSLIAGLILMLGLSSGLAHAALPSAVEGQQLPSLAPVVERTTPAVVNIAVRSTTEVRNHPFLDDPFFRRFFGVPEQPRQRESQAAGSGVIVDAAEGLILTNHHVVQNADSITVTLFDEREYQAEVVGSDQATDVALIRIDAENLVGLPIGNADALRVGDFVVAIGNPFGLQHTVTSGIVSAKGRATGISQGGYEDFIQTDAAINPGNSGGALINLRGELVGINTAIFSRSGGNIGIGFAIPMTMASVVMAQLLEYGDVQRGLLGVNIQDLTPALAEALGIPVTEGAVITRVSADSAAEAAGLQPEDVIVEVDGEPVRDDIDLRNKVGLKRVGEVVSLRYYRDGDPQSVSVRIGSAEALAVSGEAGDLHPGLAGATLRELDERAEVADDVTGIYVEGVERGSRAALSGLRPGDVITSVNRRPVADLDDLAELLEEIRRPILWVRRGEGALFIPLRD